jgi:hypothetical protein
VTGGRKRFGIVAGLLSENFTVDLPVSWRKAAATFRECAQRPELLKIVCFFLFCGVILAIASLP